MSRFRIIQERPSLFKMEILKFWEEYLPGTPSARFDWMRENPAGPAIWLFAIDEQTGKLTGTISLFPKDLFLNGKQIKAAIVGDFMLHEKFRVFGPALDLLKGAIAYQKNGQVDFLYTVPNLKSKKIVDRVGFGPAGRLYSMMRPQQCDFFLKKHVGSIPARILEKPLLLSMSLLSRATYANEGTGVFEKLDWHDTTFNDFCRQVRINSSNLLIGDYSLSYLDWRYRQHPDLDFHIFVYKEQADGKILGLFVYTLVKHRMDLYDIVSLNDKVRLVMIKRISVICKKAKCRGIYSLIYESNPLLPIVKSCCFLDAKDQIEIYTYPEQIKEISRWSFTSADRNS